MTIETDGRAPNYLRLDPFQNVTNVHWGGNLLTMAFFAVVPEGNTWQATDWGSGEKLAWAHDGVGDFEEWGFPTPTAHDLKLNLTYNGDHSVEFPSGWYSAPKKELSRTEHYQPDFVGKFVGVVANGSWNAPLVGLFYFIRIGYGTKSFWWNGKFGPSDGNAWQFHVHIATWKSPKKLQAGTTSITNPKGPAADQYSKFFNSPGGFGDTLNIGVDSKALALSVEG